MVWIPLIERCVSDRRNVRQHAHVVQYNPDHDYEMRQLRIFQKMVERGKPSPSRRLQLRQRYCIRPHLPSLPAGSLLAFVTLGPG